MRFILFIIISTIGFSSYGQYSPKPLVAVSLPPIASLVKKILGDIAEIEVIQNSSTCPHHHSLKYRDVQKIKGADYIVYIDDSFEKYLAFYLKDTKAKKIPLTKLGHFNINGSNHHYWVNKEFVIMIMQTIADYFVKQGFDKQIIDANFVEAKTKLSQLTLNDNLNVVLVGYSLEYLYIDLNTKNKKYLPSVHSIKKVKKLESAISDSTKCVIFDSDNIINSASIKSKKLQLDIEDWGSFSKIPLEDYYFQYLSTIYKQINICQ
ncbi:MAG: zinc ABC transporter substrate-binding protein [Rickettsiaceae bacterium]|nr:zinc ABC transporter substrate-binding protein [Rickettsiaceae bacterium]